MPRHRLPADPRIVIDRVEPQVDGGRHAAKRLEGDELVVAATVYREGHDLLAGRLLHRGPGDRRWRAAPLRYERDFDRLVGGVVLDRIGRWRFTVEAWTDRFASWQADLRRFVEGGVEVAAELLEGALLVEEAAKQARGRARETLADVRRCLADVAVPAVERARRALDPELGPLMELCLPPADRTRADREYPVDVDPRLAGFAAWYEMFPRSQPSKPGRHGTFADAARQLPRLAQLGFDVVYLPPVHPIGVTHRKGRNNARRAARNDPGSSWAIGSEHGGHTAVDPRLGTLEDFDRFVTAANGLGLEVALDYALQCSPDHPWVRQHPEWFYHRVDGSIKYAENPPKKYEDIYPLDFRCDDYRTLWEACRDIFLFWIEHGVRIFRVDNPHTKPFVFWEWVIGEVKRAHPEVQFLSEAFTRPARMKGLAKLGFTQSYTYFTWRNTAWELQEYLTELTRPEMLQYFRPNFFANTPDILHAYLQQGGRPAFRVRLLLAATLSPLYGIYSGFELCENTPREEGSEEYLNSEKYEIRMRDWEAPGNINDDVRLMNRLRRAHPALQTLGNLSFHRSENERILFYHKHAPGDDLLIAVNLDPQRAQETVLQVPLSRLGVAEGEPFLVEDLLTGVRYTWRDARNYVRLDPAKQVAHVLHVIRDEEEPEP